MWRGRCSLLIVGMLSLVLISPGFALGEGSGFVALPPLSGENELREMVVRRSALELDVGRYQSGRLAIKVRNKTQRQAKFVPDGLYFVPVLPEGSTERVPQRVVVAGLVSFRGRSAQSVMVGANKTVSIQLSVFCLDHHRPAPRPGQVFRVAQSRLPAQLRQAIVSGAAAIEQQHNGVVKLSRIQGHVWKVRAQQWIVLEGELPNEQAGRSAYEVSHPNSGNVDQPQLKLY